MTDTDLGVGVALAIGVQTLQAPGLVHLWHTVCMDTEGNKIINSLWVSQGDLEPRCILLDMLKK